MAIAHQSNSSRANSDQIAHMMERKTFIPTKFSAVTHFKTSCGYLLILTLRHTDIGKAESDAVAQKISSSIAERLDSVFQQQKDEAECLECGTILGLTLLISGLPFPVLLMTFMGNKGDELEGLITKPSGGEE